MSLLVATPFSSNPVWSPGAYTQNKRGRLDPGRDRALRGLIPRWCGSVLRRCTFVGRLARSAHLNDAHLRRPRHSPGRRRSSESLVCPQALREPTEAPRYPRNNLACVQVGFFALGLEGAGECRLQPMFKREGSC